MKACAEAGCSRAAPPRGAGQGLCKLHYQRRYRADRAAGIRRPFRRRGTPLATLLRNIEPDTNGGCWLWARSLNRHGYGKCRTTTAHRAMWVATHGPITPDQFVLHRCDVRACVNPEHLYLGDGKDNGRDMVIRGRSLWGERNCHAKLTNAEAAAVRRAFDGGASGTRLAALYGVTPRVIYLIAKGESYAPGVRSAAREVMQATESHGLILTTLLGRT